MTAGIGDSLVMPGTSLTTYLEELRHQVDAALTRALALPSAPAVITDAMRYPVDGGGKRLRPCLTLAVADSLCRRAGRSHDVTTWRALALPAACAIEMVHTYSLVHDDLPAMDDDALRRGRPTSHVVYGDGLAVLVGDGLLTEAFGVLARGTAAPEDRLRAVAVLADAAGAAGMVGGQAIDLAAAGRVRVSTPPLDAAGLEDMHRRKTGALIRAACTMGAIMTGADDATVDAIDHYARDLGLAFQIIDDVLDVEGSSAALGKTAGKDAASGKPTYPARYGVAGARAKAAECVARAHATLAAANLAGPLGDIADWNLTRTS